MVVSDFAYLLPFSNNFPLKFLKNINSGFTLVHISNNSACYIDVTKTFVSYKTRTDQ